MRRVVRRISQHNEVLEALPTAGADAAQFADDLANGRVRIAALNTDDKLFHAKSNADPLGCFPPSMRDGMRRRFASQGISLSGKVYKSGLAAYPGDPRALVSDRHDVQSTLEERGWGTDPEHDSMVKVKARLDDGPSALDAPYRVADRLVEERLQDALADNPEAAPTPRERSELKEQIREQITPAL